MVTSGWRRESRPFKDSGSASWRYSTPRAAYLEAEGDELLYMRLPGIVGEWWLTTQISDAVTTW